MLRFALQYDSVAVFVRDFTDKVATNGLYLKTEKPVEVGDPVAFLFRFKDGGAQDFSARGDVVWLDPEEEARSGKKGLLVRNIVLDGESQRVFGAFVRSQGQPAPTQPQARPQAPVVIAAPPPPRPQPVVQRTEVLQPAYAVSPTFIHAAPRRRWPWVVLTLVVLAGAGFGGWYGFLGGDRIIADFGVETRDGRIVEISDIERVFFMGLVNQRSSDWRVEVDAATEWIGVRGFDELRPGDRIELRYKPAGQAYRARQITVKERGITGTVGPLTDEGVLRIADRRTPGLSVELTAGQNEQIRAMVGALKAGDVVDTVYAIGATGRNVLQSVVVRERTMEGTLTTVDASRNALMLDTGEDTALALTVDASTRFEGADGLGDFGAEDVVAATYHPGTRVAVRLEMVTKYEPKKVVKRPRPVAPRKMLDVLHHTNADVGRFAFEFSRRPEFGAAVLVESPRRVYLRIPATENTYTRSEIFLSAGPVRTVRFDREGSDLVLIFLVEKNVMPRYTFEVEGNRLVAVFFTH